MIILHIFISTYSYQQYISILTHILHISEFSDFAVVWQVLTLF